MIDTEDRTNPEGPVPYNDDCDGKDDEWREKKKHPKIVKDLFTIKVFYSYTCIYRYASMREKK